jgi:ankyrin repeat protein
MGCDVTNVAALVTAESLHARTSAGATPLLLAAQAGNTPVVNSLLAAGASVSDCLPNGLFPAYVALQGRHFSAARAIIAASPAAMINACPDSHTTCLHLAAALDAADVALDLIAKGACLTPARRVDGLTPLFVACKLGCRRVAEAIVDAAVAVGQVSEVVHAVLPSGHTILHTAAQGGHADLVAFLCDDPRTRCVKCAPLWQTVRVCWELLRVRASLHFLCWSPHQV